MCSSNRGEWERHLLLGKPVDRRVRLLDEDRRIEVERVIPPFSLKDPKRPSPVQGGSTFSCYRTRDENVFCWGLNSSGQLGREGDPILPQANQLTAEQVRGLDSIRLLALGDAHACALGRDGRLFCWGENKHQQARYLPGTTRNAVWISPAPSKSTFRGSHRNLR